MMVEGGMQKERKVGATPVDWQLSDCGGSRALEVHYSTLVSPAREKERKIEELCVVCVTTSARR